MPLDAKKEAGRVQHIEALEIVIADARNGDEGAWRSLYDALSPQVMRYLRARGVRDPADVLGDAFVDLARALPRFHGDEAALVALLFRLVHMSLAEGGQPAARVSIPLERVIDAASHEVAGSDGARGAAISGRMRRRLRLLSEPGQETVLLRVFGQLSEDEARHAIAGAGSAGMPPPLRLSATGTAVLARASALVEALPVPPEGPLKTRHVQEAAESARFFSSAGAPDPEAETPHVGDEPGRPARSRSRRVVGPLLLLLVVVTAVTGLLADAVAAAGETVRRGLGQLEAPGGSPSETRKPRGGRAERLAARTDYLAEIMASPAAAEMAAPTVTAAEAPASGAAAPAHVPSSAGTAPPAPLVAPPQSEPPPVASKPPQAPDESDEEEVTPPEKLRPPRERDDDHDRERVDDRGEDDERDD